MPKSKRKQKCVTKGCTRTDITGFGLCDSHYQKHKRLVDMGRETWDQLIAEGKALPRGARFQSAEK